MPARRDYGGRVCLLAMLLAVAAVTPATSADVSFAASRNGDAIDVVASARLTTDIETAWKVLTDYGRYATFIPNLRASRALARNRPVVTVQQSGDAVLWLFRIGVDVTYEVTQSPPNRISSRAIAGNLRSLRSEYLLTPIEDGVRLDYKGRIAPGYEVLGHFEQIAVRRNIERQFRALAGEIEHHSQPATSANGSTLSEPTRRVP